MLLIYGVCLGLALGALFGDGPFGDKFADGRRGITAATVRFKTVAQLFFDGGCRAECALGIVVDDLGVNVIVGAEYRQPRTDRGSSDLTTQAPVALLRLLFAG